MLALARAIQPINRLTVISASLQVSDILADNDAIDIIQLGGSLRESSRSVVGKFAEQPLEEFSCSKLFLGVDGIDLDFGITTTDIREASLNRAMMRTAQKQSFSLTHRNSAVVASARSPIWTKSTRS